MADHGFPKNSRLLSAKDFSPVFNQPDFRVSSRYLLVLGKRSDLPAARLGVVVGKKNVNRAVQRNRIKRLVREGFRARQGDFGPLDLVVLARKGLAGFDNCDINAQLGSLLDELSAKQHRKK